MKTATVILLGTLLSATMLLSSCKKWDPWYEGGGGNNPVTTDCSISGTLVRVPCGISDLDNLWIKSDRGVYYQPCDASLVHRMDLAYPLVAGARIKFGYTAMKGASVCDNEALMLCPEKAPARVRIKLTCIQPAAPVPQSGICKPVSIVNEYISNAGHAEVLWASRSGDCITVKIRYSAAQRIDENNITLNYRDGKQIAIDLADGSRNETPPATISLFFAGLPEGTSSAGIFETTLHFGVGKILAQYPAVAFNLNGWDENI